MSSIFGGVKSPSIPTPPPAAHPASLADPSVAVGSTNQAAKNAVAASLDNTLGTTGAQGVTQAPTTAKATLLGQ